MASNKALARQRYFKQVRIMAAEKSKLHEPFDACHLESVLSGHAGSTADQVIKTIGSLRLPISQPCVRIFDERETRMFGHIVSTDDQGLDVAHVVDGICDHLEEIGRNWLSTRALPVTNPGIIDLEIVSEPTRRIQGCANVPI